jgi:hypothetical protein
MQCQECGYRLWNIQSRQCPECGKDFKPSEFDFVPSSVAFCCPHCEQSYFGTDERGHLVPIEFECIGCQQHIHMDQMILRPAVGYEEQQTHVADNPWIKRDPKKSTIMAWLRTTRKAMFHPKDLVSPRMMGSTTGIRPSVSFLLFHTAMTALCGLGIFLPFMAVGMVNDDNPVGMIFTALVWIVMGVMSVSLIALVFVAIWSAVVHVILNLLAKPKGEYIDTFDCMSFSNGACVMMAIPVCGVYGLVWIAAIWWPISAGIMLAKQHQVSVFKALVATWLLPMVLMVGSAGLVGYSIYSIYSI